MESLLIGEEKMMTTEILCAGNGGQGILVTGLILASAAMDQGKNILWYPSYGVEMRGGTANCNVKISDEEIASPFAAHPDILIVMNEASVNKFEQRVKPGGVMFVNSSAVKKRVYRNDIRVCPVPALSLANEEGNRQGANIVVLGALSVVTNLFEPVYLANSMDAFFLKKGRINSKNRPCFERGMKYAMKELI